MSSKHNIPSTSKACLKDLQANEKISGMLQHQTSFSPIKHQSFILPLKIKDDSKMAATQNKEIPSNTLSNGD